MKVNQYIELMRNEVPVINSNSQDTHLAPHLFIGWDSLLPNCDQLSTLLPNKLDIINHTRIRKNIFMSKKEIFIQ